MLNSTLSLTKPFVLAAADTDYAMLGLLLLFVGFVIMGIGGLAYYFIKKRLEEFKQGKGKDDAMPLPPLPELLAREAQTMPPQDQLERHRHETALENRGRDEACRIAKALQVADGDKTKSIWLLAGPGPLGAVAMIAARHLDALGLKPVVQLLVFVNKLGPDAKREHKTLTASRISILESPVPKPPKNCGYVAVCADPAALPEIRHGDLDQVISNAEAEGLPAEILDPFDAHYVSPVPDVDEVVIAVPDDAVSREESRLLDSLAQQHYGVQGPALMENAGYWASRETYNLANEVATQRGDGDPEVFVVCGRGNNGGDGMVIARNLRRWGLYPTVFLLGEKNKTSEDTGKNLRLLEAEGIKVVGLIDESQWAQVDEAFGKAHLLVDAMLGTGMQGNVRGDAKTMIERFNAAKKKGVWVLAVDSPSGLDCNTGEALGSCVTADVTVTFAADKIGFSKAQGPALCGKVVTADIGLPRELYRRRANRNT